MRLQFILTQMNEFLSHLTRLATHWLHVNHMKHVIIKRNKWQNPYNIHGMSVETT